MVSQNAFNMLVENKWKKYDAQKMRKKKATALIVIMIFLWIIEFQVFLIVINSPIYGMSPASVSALIATIIVIVVIAVTWIIIRKIDVEKDGWYFSAYGDKSLHWDALVSFIRAFLNDRGYLFEEEGDHKAGNLRITYFSLMGKDFKIRLWFTKIGGTPVVEIGVGPENEVNGEEIKKIRDGISEEFRAKFSNMNP